MNWILPLSAAVHIGMAFALATFVSWAARMPEHSRRVFVLASSFSNSNALPVVLLDTVARDFIPADTTAFERGVGYIGFYLICWSVVCWSLGLAYIAQPPRAEPALMRGSRGQFFIAVEAQADEEQKAVATKGHGTTSAEMHLETVPDTQEAERKDSGARERRGNGGDRAGWYAACAGFVGNVVNPPIVGILLGVAVGMSPAKGLLVGPRAPLRLVHRITVMLGDAAVSVSTLVSGASLVVGEGTSVAALARQLRTPEFTGVLALRTVLVPLLGWLGFLAADRLGVFAALPGASVDPMLKFVILIQAAMPSANNTVMMTNLVLGERPARLAAAMMAAQFLILPLTLTFWTALFLATAFR